jgi:hypothetical membrane protein
MNQKVLALCGILAPVVYVLTVMLGGVLRQDYSHVSQAVSDLIAIGAPNKSLLDPLFALYNLLGIAFALGLLRHLRSVHQNRGKVIGALGALVLAAQGLFGLMTLFFPEPAGGMAAAITHTGAMHIIFAGLSSLTSILAILFMGFWFRKGQRLHGYGLYSFLSAAAVFLSGGLAAYSVATQSPVAGLIERITIGGFLQWMFLIALMMHSSEGADASPGSRPTMHCN